MGNMDIRIGNFPRDILSVARSRFRSRFRVFVSEFCVGDTSIIYFYYFASYICAK